MTEQDEELLLNDICARIPYEVIGAVEHYNETTKEPVNLLGVLWGIDGHNRVQFAYLPEYTDDQGAYNYFDFRLFKPYLRPLSSMTDEEKKEYQSLCELHFDHDADDNTTYCYFDTSESFDWLNAHHFDYRGLIEKGLAISTEGLNLYN